MTKLDPIIAVQDIEASSIWYQQVFGFRKKHGGNEFAVLISENDEVVICLHKWGEHQHPTMVNPIAPGNGLILYLKTENIHKILQNVINAGGVAEEDIHVNPNSLKMEFSIKDPDGYFWTVTEFHQYEG